MLKKLFVLIVVFVIFLVLIIPSGGSPKDVVLDQQIEPLIPGVFQLIHSNRDQKAEAIKFTIVVRAYREGNFIVTGNLEGEKNGEWLAVATSVISFPWTPENNKIELIFPTSNLIKYEISGPYRVMIAIKSGGWEFPVQIAGFSPKYIWSDFSRTERIAYGEINTGSEAERAAETWAEYKEVKLGALQEINFDYDHWQVDFQGETGETLRFLVSPEGSVDMLKFSKNSGSRNIQNNEKGTDTLEY